MKTSHPKMCLLAIATSFLVVGCVPLKSEKELRGQAFVVQKDRTTLKLSLVHVDAVDTDAASKRITLKKSEASEKVKMLRDKLRELDVQTNNEKARIRDRDKAIIDACEARLKLKKHEKSRLGAERDVQSKMASDFNVNIISPNLGNAINEDIKNMDRKSRNLEQDCIKAQQQLAEAIESQNREIEEMTRQTASKLKMHWTPKFTSRSLGPKQ